MPRLVGGRAVAAALCLAAARGDDHTCAAGLTVDAYANGASEGFRRLDLAASHCASAAAFEAAVSKAVCGDAVACHVRDAAGRRAATCQLLSRLSAEAGVQPPGAPRAYAVPRDMRFVFATEDVGFRRTLPHLNMVMTTLALRPRLFALDNFMTVDDATALVEDALAISDEEHKLLPSSTGAKGYRVSDIRTSENAWVKDTPTASRLKRRAFELLAFDGYDERMADGVQVLRYNNSNGYVAHKDYLTRPAGVSERAMDPSRGGANRLATVFLYLSDVAHGGQTVFPKVDRPADAASVPALESRPLDDTVRGLRDAMEKQSWEPKLVDDCYSKLAAAPAKGRAILFYSQHPDGTLDDYATHGGCPVLDGQKWAANLWVWNKPMPFGSTRFGTATDGGQSQNIEGVFTTEFHGVSIYWQETKMGDMVPGSPFQVNSFHGHSFTARRGGVVLETFTIDAKAGTNRFVVTA